MSLSEYPYPHHCDYVCGESCVCSGCERLCDKGSE